MSLAKRLAVVSSQLFIFGHVDFELASKISMKRIMGRDVDRPSSTPYVQSKFCDESDLFLLTSQE